MHLNNAQLQQLKTAINANPAWAAYPNTTDGNIALAAELDKVANPAYFVFKTSISQGELQNGVGVHVDQTPTSFDWANTGGFINRSQGERDAYRTLFQPGVVNPSQPSVRAAFADIFNGNGAGATNNIKHFSAMTRRPCTNFEQIYAVNTAGSAAGRGTAADPDTLGLTDGLELIVSPIGAQHVETARNLV